MRQRNAILGATVVAGLLGGGCHKGHESIGGPPTACTYLTRSIDAKPTGPVFLPSYPTVTSGPLNQVAFLYDNAAATIALVACGESKRAERIGDAILVALDHDRYWHDGRLRNGYLAGPVGPGPVKLAGWWDTKQGKWVEDRYQVGSDNGNLAWAMLALLALDDTASNRRYRDGAARIGTWVSQWSSALGPGGFTGGTFAHEPMPIIERWKSTEHNTDLAAAFRGLAQATGDTMWAQQAQRAEKFVHAMWTPSCQCFAVGTIADGITHNPQLALDAQIWPLLALPDAATRYGSALTPARSRLSNGRGFTYSEAAMGLWTEGTAQVALLMELSGHGTEAENLIKLVGTMRASDGSYYATNTKELSTGFMLDTNETSPRRYFHVAHLAAVSWAAIAEQRYNPFIRKSALP